MKTKRNKENCSSDKSNKTLRSTKLICKHSCTRHQALPNKFQKVSNAKYVHISCMSHCSATTALQHFVNSAWFGSCSSRMNAQVAKTKRWSHRRFSLTCCRNLRIWVWNVTTATTRSYSSMTICWLCMLLNATKNLIWGARCNVELSCRIRLLGICISISVEKFYKTVQNATSNTAVRKPRSTRTNSVHDHWLNVLTVNNQ